MQVHVGEERSNGKESCHHKNHPSLPSWNHPLKSLDRVMLSLFEQPILGLERNVVTRLKWRILMEKMLDAQEQLVREKTKIYHFAPVLVLIVLAPTLAEVLLGNVLFNGTFVWQLVIDTVLYGSGAILVREVARRRHLGWLGIVVLALAYGVVEEGLVLQSLFNPHFPGLESMGSYGRLFGVNWFWASYVLGLHTVWSITLPILLTELLFPRLQSRPWLGRAGLGIDATVYVLICLLLWQTFRSYSHFSASPIELICTALLVVALVSLVLFVVPRLVAAPGGRKAPVPWPAGLMAFVAAMLFSGLFLFLPTLPGVPSLLSILLYVALYVAVVTLVRRWSTQRLWSTRHLLALASGALIETMLFGFLLVSRGRLADLMLHLVLCVVLLLGLWWIARRLRATQIS
jgi:hypothetical protein